MRVLEETPRKGGKRIVLESRSAVPWVEAETKFTVLQQGRAERFLAENKGFICEVRLSERPDTKALRIDARWMEASCPHCGRRQPLLHSGWVYVPGWECESIAALVSKPEKGRAFSPYDGDFPLPFGLEFKHLEDCRSLARPYGEENPSIAALEELAQAHIKFDGKQFTKKFGSLGNFAGTYICAECSKPFSALRKDFYAKDEIRNFEPNWLADRTTFVPRCQVTVDATDRCMTISGQLGHGTNQVVIDFVTGETFIDGRRVCASNWLGHVSLPEIIRGRFNVFNEYDLFSVIFELLPSWLRNAVGGFRYLGNLWNVILHNRFCGYPQSFFKRLDQASYPDGTLLDNVVALPRDYYDLDMAWPATGLPRAKSLRRILFGDLALFGQVCSINTLPFKNVDVLARLLNDARASELMGVLADGDAVACVWRRLAQAKGEAKVLDFILRTDLSQLKMISGAFARVRPKDVEDLFCGANGGLGALSLNELTGEIVHCYEWDAKHPCRRSDQPISYSDFQRSLEAEVGGYSFVLPKTPREFFHAAEVLHNCLHNYPEMIDGWRTVVLVANDSGKLCGAIELHDGKVFQVRGAYNSDLRKADTGAFDRYSKWLVAKGLTADAVA